MADLLVVFVMWIGTGSDELWVKRPVVPDELIGMTREQVVEKLGRCWGSCRGNREYHGGIGTLIGMRYKQYGITLSFENGKVKTASRELVQPVEVAPMPRQVTRERLRLLWEDKMKEYALLDRSCPAAQQLREEILNIQQMSLELWGEKEKQKK
jgi:hypothetical protein